MNTAIKARIIVKYVNEFREICSDMEFAGDELVSYLKSKQIEDLNIIYILIDANKINKKIKWEIHILRT